jgi:hypothetical protein
MPFDPTTGGTGSTGSAPASSAPVGRFVGERRALAAIVMAFYFLVYGVMAVQQVQPEFTKAFVAIAGVYGLAFFSLVAGYFWARWYSVGVGLYGVITAAVGMWQLGTEPVLLFVGGTHLAATLMLWGSSMSKPYDGRTEWREKLHMDEHAVQRLGRSVIRAGITLPFILLYAFMPKPGMAETAISIAAVVLATFGLRGLVQLKTWGVLAIGAAGTLLLAFAGAEAVSHGALALQPAVGGVLLISSIAPFLWPIVRFLGLSPSAR